MSSVCYKCKSKRILSGSLTHSVENIVPGYDDDCDDDVIVCDEKTTPVKGWRGSDIEKVVEWVERDDPYQDVDWIKERDRKFPITYGETKMRRDKYGDSLGPIVGQYGGIAPSLIASCCADCGAVEIISNLPKLDKGLDAELAYVAEAKAEEKAKEKAASKKAVDAKKKRKQKKLEKLENEMNKLKKELDD